MNLALKYASCVLTDAQGQVEQSHANIQSEEQDHIGHFTEQDDVPYMLLNRYCATEEIQRRDGSELLHTHSWRYLAMRTYF